MRVAPPKSVVALPLFLVLCMSSVFAQSNSPPGAVGDGGTYKIQNVSNNKFLTVAEEGVVGLKTGLVITATDPGRLRAEQLWALTWDPIAQEDHQGYRIQSKKDFLNDVTSYYPEGRSYAHINVWRLKHLGGNKWHVQNVRTRKCLSLKAKGVEVEEDKCTKSVRQQWTFRSIIHVPEEDDETHILATNSRFPYSTNESSGQFKRPSQHRKN